jgi:hypothetical protein
MKPIKTRTIIIALFIILVLAVIFGAPYTNSTTQWLAYVVIGIFAGISAIGEIITLLGRKKDLDDSTSQQDNFAKPNLFRPKSDDKSAELFRTSVGLWGPAASGKSWLVNAFAHTLRAKYTEPLNGLRYELNSVWTEYLSNLYRAPNATQLNHWTNPQVFRFERRRTSNNPRESLSSFAHEISIFDYSGEHSQTLLLHDDDEFLNHVLVSVAKMDIIILALDPIQPYLSKDEYAKLVERLFTVLDKINPNKKRFYAICLTKADVIPVNIDADPNGIIELKFGTKMIDIFKEVSKKHEIQTFVTSSFGYIPGTDKANFDREKQQIVDIENWKPYGVEYPFFWAFESVELTRIKKKFRFGILDTKNYIHYPKP